MAKGDLVKPELCACGGSPVKGHHADYSRPLDVEWVCEMCHRLRHGSQRDVRADGPMLSFRVSAEVAAEIDALAGSNRSAFLRQMLVDYLAAREEAGVVRERVVSRSQVMTEALDHALGRGPLRAPKAERLEVARAVKSSAEAKAGLAPIGWREGA